MNKRTIYTALISLFAVAVFALVSASSDSVIFRAKILVCGDGIAEPQEACDGSDFKGASCLNYGYLLGDLNCTPACELETLYCNTPIPVPSTVGGGGGVNPRFRSKVVFSGVAGSYSTIVVLIDGKIHETEMASRDGSFRVIVSDLNEGSYNFSIYSKDDKGKFSKSQSYFVKFTEPETREFKDINLLIQQSVNKADVNADGKVNLVDFSILLYWFNKTVRDNGADLNKDNKIDLADFSILAYYWTG